LRVGDLLVGHDGRWVEVEDALDTGEYERVYNLRVADFHTYFVGCQEWGWSVWAHNEYKGGMTAEKAEAELKAAGVDWRTARRIARMGDEQGVRGNELLVDALGWAKADPLYATQNAKLFIEANEATAHLKYAINADAAMAVEAMRAGPGGLWTGTAKDALRRASAAYASEPAITPAESQTRSMLRGGLPPLELLPMSSTTPTSGGRQAGIDRAWAQEVALIRATGRGTAPWTDPELGLIRGGASFGDLNYTGHHINKVADYRAWAGDPRNIAFLKQGSGEAHMRLGHPGGTAAPQPEGYLIDRAAMLANFIQ
jgi:hypothetical protein